MTAVEYTPTSVNGSKVSAGSDTRRDETREILRHPLILCHMRPNESDSRRHKRMEVARSAWKQAHAEGREFTLVLAEGLALLDHAWLLRQLTPKARKEERRRIVADVRRKHGPSDAAPTTESAMSTVASHAGEARTVAARAPNRFTFSSLSKGATTSNELWLEANRALEQNLDTKRARRADAERERLRELFVTLADMEGLGIVPESMPLNERLLLAVDPTIPLPETKPRKPFTDADMQAVLAQLDLPPTVASANKAMLYVAVKSALETQKPILPQVETDPAYEGTVEPFALSGALVPSDPAIPWAAACPDEQSRRLRRFRYLVRRFSRSQRGRKLQLNKLTLTLADKFDPSFVFPDARTFVREIEKRGGTALLLFDLGGKFGRPHWHAEILSNMTYKQLRSLWTEVSAATVKPQQIAFIKGSKATTDEARSESNQTYRIEFHRSVRYLHKPVFRPLKPHPRNIQFLVALQFSLGQRSVGSGALAVLQREALVLTQAPADFNPFTAPLGLPSTRHQPEPKTTVTSTTMPALPASAFVSPTPLLKAHVEPSEPKNCGLVGCPNPLPKGMRGYCCEEHTKEARRGRRRIPKPQAQSTAIATTTPATTATTSTGPSDHPQAAITPASTATVGTLGRDTNKS